MLLACLIFGGTLLYVYYESITVLNMSFPVACRWRYGCN